MFTTDAMLRMHGWTHGCYQRLLEHLAGFEHEELLKELPGFGWPTIHSQVMHIVEAEAFWVTNAQGQKFIRWHDDDPWYVFSGFDSVDEIITRFHETAAATCRFIGSLNDAGLLISRRITISGGSSMDIEPAKMLTHIMTHGFHHKGQVAAMCRLLGNPAPDTDLA